MEFLSSKNVLSVAPMMDWTDRHCRYFHRLLAPDALLYTEMVTSGAVIHGDREYLLGFDPAEHPVALQLGGSEPADLARSAVIGHMQRGGAPTQFDRILGTRVGVKAADLVASKKFGKMVALRGNDVVGVSLREATSKLKTVPKAWLDLADTLTRG